MKVKLVGMALVVGMSGLAYAADTDVKAELQALKAQLNAQQARIAAQDAQISQLKGESWLTERRAEEVKTLIHEVLSDAETRASLLDSGMTAGYKDGFFLASDDGNFRLNIKGQLQIRYVYNHSDQNDAVFGAQVPEVQEGFDIARAKLGFYGHMFDPKLTYGISGEFAGAGGFAGFAAATPNDGDFELDDAFVAYEFADGWQVKAGQFQAPFLREEAVDSSMQLAVERSVVADAFTIDYTQGVQVSYAGEAQGVPFRAALMMHDGSYMANQRETPSSGNDLYDFAIAGRAEVLLAGSWDQFDDFATWAGAQNALMVGAAFDYEDGANRMAGTAPNISKWTVDASAELPELSGLNLFVAYVGMDTAENDATMLTPNTSPWGVVAQASVFVIPDKMDTFIRYEYIDLDPNRVVFAPAAQVDDRLNIVTIGTNYYLHKHAAKASLDLLYAMDNTMGMPVNGGGVLPGKAMFLKNGMTNSPDDQLVIRAQVQLLF